MAMSVDERRARNRESMRRYRANNPEAYYASQRRYYWNNREKMLEKNRLWRERNPERFKDIQAAWRERNKKHLREYDRRYKAHNRLPEPQGKTVTEALFEHEVFAAAYAAVPRGLEASIRDDVIGDIIVAVYEGDLTVEEIPAKAKRFVTDHFRRFSTYKHVPIEGVRSL